MLTRFYSRALSHQFPSYQIPLLMTLNLDSRDPHTRSSTPGCFDPVIVKQVYLLRIPHMPVFPGNKWKRSIPHSRV